MTKKWPAYDVQESKGRARGSGSSGGKGAGSWVMYSLTVRTQMKCGEEIKKRAPKVFEDRRRDVTRDLIDDVGIAARRHLSSCKKCQGKS